MSGVGSDYYKFLIILKFAVSTNSGQAPMTATAGTLASGQLATFQPVAKTLAVSNFCRRAGVIPFTAMKPIALSTGQIKTHRSVCWKGAATGILLILGSQAWPRFMVVGYWCITNLLPVFDL